MIQYSSLDAEMSGLNLSLNLSCGDAILDGIVLCSCCCYYVQNTSGISFQYSSELYLELHI